MKPLNHQRSNGFSLIELLIAVAIVGVLASIAYPSYQDYIDRKDVAIAMTEISDIDQRLKRFQTVHNSLPASLSDLGLSGDDLNDPWGNPYQYLDISTVKGKGPLRKNKNQVPINTDYDLYSTGKDGKSASPLTAASSQDDIVRANNGGYIGLGSDYSG